MAKRKSTVDNLKEKIVQKKEVKLFRFGVKVESDNVLTYLHVFCSRANKIIATFYAGKFYTEDAKLAARLEELGYKENEVRDLDAEDIQPLGLSIPIVKTQADVDKANAE